MIMKWINVKDRLPENPQTDVVLCYIENSKEWMNGGSRMYVGVINSADVLKTTHWMPLPEPPKQD